MAQNPSHPDTDRFKRWFDALATRDPKLHEELARGIRRRAAVPEALFEAASHDPGSRDPGSHDLASAEAGADDGPRMAGGQLTGGQLTGAQPTTIQLQPRPDIVFETMVREGRPALPVVDDRIRRDQPELDAVAKELVTRLLQAAPRIEPMLPLVGRIDVANHPMGAAYLGTGWVLDHDNDRLIIVTNRHVADLMVRADATGFAFRPGRFGTPMECSLDYLHELGRAQTAASKVRRVLWIETDPNKADLALLEVEPRPGAARIGDRPRTIPLAAQDAAPDTDVVVIGYPARASASTIPNQAWMDRVYESTYDVKRIAPGLIGPHSRGWATHDCTTLGGCSGGVVLDFSGKAVALHFAGLYMIENYAVPASTLTRYMRDEVWRSPVANVTTSRRMDEQPRATQPIVPPVVTHAATNAPATNAGEVSFTIPLKISVSLGQPATPLAALTPLAPAAPATPPPSTSIDQAAHALRQAHRIDGLLGVRPGYIVANNRLTDRDCLVAAAHPERVDAVRAALPASFSGYPVDVRRASITEQIAGTAIDTEATARISYNDADRTGPEFSFDIVDEEMTATLHVGPERSWTELRAFLEGTRRDLVSSMYEFHAKHIADAVEQELDEGAEMQLVVARNSRDPLNGEIPAGDFDRSERFADWHERFDTRFSHIFVPIGTRGLVANSYHIKVTVRDRQFVWLSSGNWKRASQPLIPAASLDDPARTSRAGNREWHVILDNRTLATRFRSHINEDFDQSKRLGGTTEGIEDQPVYVDVPIGGVEGVELEAAPARVLEPKTITRRLRVKPLLTPDRQGDVYCQAVLELIRSARTQLLFQNQYIKMDGVEDERFGELVDALVRKAKTLDDCRILLRTGDSFMADVEQLKRRGVPVADCVRRISATHTKGIIVDGRRVLVGSHNWSASGVTLNRDASLIFHDEEVAQYFAEAFELDWARAPELSLQESVELPGARVADPASPVPAGFVRMTLSEFLEG